MKWDQLLASMDEETFKDLRYQVSQEDRKRMVERVKTFPELSEIEKDLAFSGHKIEAIKHYRESVGCVLAEAKEKVEQYLNRIDPSSVHCF